MEVSKIVKGGAIINVGEYLLDIPMPKIQMGGANVILGV